MKDIIIIGVLITLFLSIFALKRDVIYEKQLIAAAQTSQANATREAVTNRVLQRELDQYDEFKRALGEVDLNYDRATNNCYSHSIRLQKALAAVGIQSSILINKGRNHAWLGVWIEATNGSFVPPDNKLQIIEVRDQQLNVICADPELSKVGISTGTFPALWRD